jgi:hypothetical protein
VSTFCAAGEEHLEAELGDVLNLALRGPVVDGHERVVEESKERRAVILVVGNRRRQRLGRGSVGGVAPALEFSHDGTDALLSMLTVRVSAQRKLLCFLLLSVHGAEEGAAFRSEHGLGGRGITKFAAAVGVTAGFEYVA